MNKNKKFVLNIVIFIGLLFLITPDDTFAQYKNQDAKKTCGKTSSAWNKACGDKYGITIKADDYQRITGIGANETSKRKITIKAKSDAVYRIKILYGDIDSLDNLSLDSLSDIDTEIDSDDGIKVKKATMKNGEYEWNLPPGKEALVLVILAGGSYEWDSGKNCTTNDGKSHDVLCKAGNAEVDGTDVELKGVSASLYVENPKESGLVENIMWEKGPFGNACQNAAQGKYADSKNNPDENSEYTKRAQENKQAWNNLYNSVLGNYCGSQSFAFNLKDSQIRKISNQLLELFYYNYSFDNAKSNIESLANVEKEIASIKASINDNSRIFENETPVINNLTCKNNSIEKESTDYLYVSKKDTIKTEKLSNGKKYKVCAVQCYEHLTVTYDPPVASIAGLCFTYKVTVKSETKCGMDTFDDYKNALINKNACSPIPICSNDESHTQAGPSEDFDNCIKKCDDGKYSQKCINECYSEVYGKETTEKNKNDNEKLNSEKISNNNLEQQSKQNLANLNQVSTDYEIAKLAFDIENEDNLEKYYKENNFDTCNTSNLVKWFRTNPNNEKQEKCAKYFFYAKALYPYGHYNSSGTKWISDSKITSAGATTKEVSHIPMQIARSSPFYLRSEGSTRELLKSLVGYTKNGIWYKYNIKYGENGSGANGVKRQYSTRYICKESCTYTGCSGNDALNAKVYAEDTIDDLEKIETALKNCQATSACETTETTSNFEIKILNPRKENENNEVDKTGTTELKKTEPTSENITCPDEGKSEENAGPDDRFSMFVPDDEDKNSKYGILGLCYDNRTTNPQYKTTITFPGSWINYKARKIKYDKKTCNSGWELKGGYFCSAYDSTDVNAEWWKWRMQMKDSDGNVIYPTFKEPKINNNIQASAKNFGKYNWNINYSCFYGIYNGTAECEDCTKLQDYKFKVIDAGNLFTDDSNQRQGYNWTSAATVTEGVNVNDARAITYKIDPQKYINYINTYEKDEKIYDTKDEDYYIYLSSDGIKHIKEKYKTRAYADYDENGFKEDPNVKGLARYTSELLETLSGYGNKDIYIEKADDIKKTNNNYSNLNSLLGTD